MLKKILISPKALDDLQTAIEYYNQQRKGLGTRFGKTVSEGFSGIQKMPRAATFAYDKVRYKVMDRFPFLIIYEEFDTEIAILRIFNTHQNQEKL